MGVGRVLGSGPESPARACWWPWGTSSSPVPLSPQAQRHISDLYEDLRDGHNLISLLEVLSGDSLVRVPAHPRLPLGVAPAFHPDTPACLPFLGPFLYAHSTSSLAQAPPVSPGLECWAQPGSGPVPPGLGLVALLLALSEP